jgi:uncharacterized protein
LAIVKKRRQAIFYFRVAMAAVALLLPMLSLVVMGSIWLWQHGYVLYWALAACSITLITYALERWLFGFDSPDTAPSTEPTAADAGNAGWSTRETAAWSEIIELSKQVRPLEITSSNDIMDLGRRSIETVARSMHPGEEHALWKFTLPEAFAIAERVSIQLSAFISGSIPLGDRMTVGQFMRLYRWRSAINVAEQAYDLWRIVRLMNPAAAATQEIREQLTRRAYDWGREELAKRLVQAYVREVGRAAIDLYSGRMRVADSIRQLPDASMASAHEYSGTAGAVAEPVRILIAGQIDSGQSALINALVKDSPGAPMIPTTDVHAPFSTSFTDGHEVLLIESPGVTEATRELRALFEATDQSDMIIWVTSSTGSDRRIDRRILSHIRTEASKRADRKPQPILCIVTHMAPPAAGSAGLTTIAKELNVASRDVIAVSLYVDSISNIDALRQRITDLMPEANRAKVLRILQNTKPKMKWGRLWSQVKNASRSLRRDQNL